MIIEIRQKDSTYEVNIGGITQVCGLDYRKKRFIFNSIEKKFESKKYLEYESEYIDNLLIDGNDVGNKYFKVYRIRNIEDIISFNKLGKNSLMAKYIKECVSSLSFQTELEKIEVILTGIFSSLNEALIKDFIDIKIDYLPEDILSFVSNSEITSIDNKFIENENEGVLMENMVVLLEKIQQYYPQKTIIIIDNIDHLISNDEYSIVFERMKEVSHNYPVYFMLGVSTDGYIHVDEENLEYINVINEETFYFPEYEHLMEFVSMNYPCTYSDDDSLMKILPLIVNYIGRIGVERNVKMDILLKMINRSLQIETLTDYEMNALEKAFLMDR